METQTSQDEMIPDIEYGTTNQTNVAPIVKRNNNLIKRQYELRGSKRTPKSVLRLSPSMDGKLYDNVTLTQISSFKDTHNSSLYGIVSVCMTQYSLKKGIDKFVVCADSAINEDLKQLHDRGSFLPVKKDQIPIGDLKNLLESHIF